MPNISFDIFFDQDFINLSASRSKYAPKAKPEWKVRTAPKLPLKEAPANPTATPKPATRPTINSTYAAQKEASAQHKGQNKTPEPADSVSVTSQKRKVSNALQPTIQNAVGSAGSMAGGAINAVGSSINGVGDSINSNIKHYGDGAKDYGNAVMDWTKSTGSRGQTASNPLGLSSNAAGGKKAVTGPDIYRPAAKPKPKASTVSTSTAGKSAAPKVLTTTSKKKVEGTTPAKKPATVGAKTATPPVAATKTISAASKPKTASATKITSSAPTKKAAANPLGLTPALKK